MCHPRPCSNTADFVPITTGLPWYSCVPIIVQLSSVGCSLHTPLLYDQQCIYLIAASDVVHNLNSTAAVSLIARQLGVDGPV